MNDFSLLPGRLDVFGGWAMALLTSNIELDISGFISFVNFLQFEASIVTPRTAHVKRFLHGRLLETPIVVIPIL
jgi:hypothetical protein